MAKIRKNLTDADMLKGFSEKGAAAAGGCAGASEPFPAGNQHGMAEK